MPRLKSANNVTTRLSAAITAADLSFVVTDASKLPAVPFRISIENEIMEVTAVDGPTNTLTVTRGLEGSPAAVHAANVFVNHSFTAGTYDELMDASASQAFVGDVTVKKSFPTIILDALRAAKSKLFWNADAGGDAGLEFHVDGQKAATLQADGTLTLGGTGVGSLRTSNIDWGTNRTIALPSGYNIDNITKSGWYDVQNPSGTKPPVTNSAWFFVQHIAHTLDPTLFAVQKSFDFFIEGGAYIRVKQNGVWSKWRRNWHSGNDGKNSGLDADLFRGRNIRDSTRASLLTNGAVATTVLFPLGMTAGAEAVSDPSGRYVYVETPANALTTSRFFRRDFEEMWNFPGAGIAGWQELSPVSTIGQVWQDGADLLTVYNSENAAGYDIYAIFGGPVATPNRAFARYNVDTDTWTRLADLPEASLPGSFIVAGENRDEIYFIAGSKAAATTFLYRYNISTDTWSASLANLPAAMTTNSGTCGTRAGRHIFMKLGATNNVARFDTSTNVLQGPTALGTAAAVGAKMIYMEGGLFLLNTGGSLTTPLCQENYYLGTNAGNAIAYSYVYNGTVLFDALGKVYFGAGNNTTTMLSWGH